MSHNEVFERVAELEATQATIKRSDDGFAARGGRARQPQTIFLTCPYGQAGGGMGSIMMYLLSRGGDCEGRFRFETLDPRGGGSVVWFPFHLAKALLRIVAEAATGRLALVHLNVAERGSVLRKGVLLFAAKALGVNVLLHLHAAQILAFYEDLPRAGRFLVRAMFRSADHCAVLGGVWQRWLTESLGVARERVTIVDNGVPRLAEPRVPRPPGAPFRLLFLGNLQERKGISDLLQALARPEMRSAHLDVTVAGGGPVECYRESAARLGLAGRVHFTGWVDPTSARCLLARSDGLVLPSYDEGLPLVILEAMAAGVPVVCTPVGAIPEIFEDRRTALLVKPGNQQGLAAALIELSRDPALQERLSIEGLALFEHRFTMERFAEQMTSLYAKIYPAHEATVPEGSEWDAQR